MLKALTQLIVGLAHMLAQNVSAGGFVLAEVAVGPLAARFSIRSAREEEDAGSCVGGGGRLALDQTQRPSAKTRRTAMVTAIARVAKS